MCKNYVELNVHFWQYRQFLYFDVPEYFADQLFVNKKIKVRFWKELKNDENAYVIIICKIRRKDRKAFWEVMSELSRKMMLMGYSGYDDFCKETIKMLEDGSN